MSASTTVNRYLFIEPIKITYDLRNIIFIGGIHGSGKGTICEALKKQIDIIHLTASEVLKWNELSTQQEKFVKNISATQNRLIINLNKIVQNNKTYLLDGHYCLLNKDGVPEKISIHTFEDIKPTKLILVTAKPQIIKERLKNRDAKTYSIKLINEFQNLEINYAKEISKNLEIPILVINNNEFKIENLLFFLK